MRVQTTVLALLLILAAALPARAQRTTASIRGTVTDATGGVVPGADVTVKGTDTGLTQSTVTNTDGVYSFPELPVGTYSVEVTISGFKSSVQTGIALNVADQRTVNVTLETGAVSETVTVTSPAMAVQTVGGEVAGLVTGEQVRELPLNGRNFLQLTTLMPGVSAGNDFNTKDRGLMSNISLAVSGSGQSNNMWMVDGANNNDVGSNRTILVFPSVDAIEEFKVHRNSYSAEFGGASGAQVNIVTRSGTNEFHGSGYYFGRNDSLASTDYFLKQAGQPKGPLSINDFGGTIGGPVMKDRLHFFWSEEWNKEKRGITRATFVPTELERVGDFSGPEIPDCSSPEPIDPLTGAGVPRQQDSGRPVESRGTPGHEALPAAQHHAGLGQLQQLGDRGQHADQLAAGKRTRGLHVHQPPADDGALHARQLDESVARRREPVGRRSVPGR